MQHMIERGVDIVDSLSGLECVVMHVDVGEYTHLCQQLHGDENKGNENKILLLFGVFHLELVLIRTISKLAADAGFTEMLIHGGIFSSELAAQKAWGGKMYNNAVVAMRSLPQTRRFQNAFSRTVCTQSHRCSQQTPAGSWSRTSKSQSHPHSQLQCRAWCPRGQCLVQSSRHCRARARLLPGQAGTQVL
jgi:hypothetical protein